MLKIDNNPDKEMNNPDSLRLQFVCERLRESNLPQMNFDTISMHRRNDPCSIEQLIENPKEYSMYIQQSSYHGSTSS